MIQLQIVQNLLRNLHSTGVELCPGGDELPKVVGAQDGGVSGQVVEVVHDDGHEQVDHDEAAEEDEGDKVEVGGVAATGLVWVEKFPCCLIPAVALLVTGPTSLAGQHDVRPGLSSGASYNTNKPQT